MGEFAVRTQDLTRTYGSTIAVNSLNLTVPTGAVFGLIGPNGAGKSTAIRLLLGLLKPSSGRATVLGFDTVTEADRIRERSGAVLETCSLYGHLSALENLEFYGRIWRMPAAERRARARRLLGRLGLWERRRGGSKLEPRSATAALHRSQYLPSPVHPLPRRTDGPASIR